MCKYGKKSPAYVGITFLFYLFTLCRKIESDLRTNGTSIQEAEGAYNAPVLANQQSSEGKKHLGQRLNKKKGVEPIQVLNPYSTPEALLHATGKESSNMMEQMR